MHISDNGRFGDDGYFRNKLDVHIVSAISYLQTYLKMRSIAPIQLALCCRRRIRLPKHFNWPFENHLVAEFFTLALSRKRPSLKVTSAATASWTTATVSQIRTSTLELCLSWFSWPGSTALSSTPHFCPSHQSYSSALTDSNVRCLVRRRLLAHYTQNNQLYHINRHQHT